MRNAAVLTLSFGLAAIASGASAMPFGAAAPTPAVPSALTRVEYFCSAGFVPTYGGRCVATPARDEIELFVETPTDEPVYRPRRHHGVRARY